MEDLGKVLFVQNASPSMSDEQIAELWKNCKRVQSVVNKIEEKEEKAAAKKSKESGTDS